MKMKADVGTGNTKGTKQKRTMAQVGTMQLNLGITKALLLLLLITALAWPAATTVNTNFLQIDPRPHFNTDLSLNTGLTITGTAPGDTRTSTLSNGDSVCTGSTITISPTVTTTWAASSLDILSLNRYRTETVPPASSLRRNQRIRWLSPEIFESELEFGTSIIGSIDTPEHYLQLAPFETEPVTYYLEIPATNVPSEGGAMMYCEGALRINDEPASGAARGTLRQISSSGSSTTDPTTITMTGTGTHTISTSLEGIDCFAAVTTHEPAYPDPNFRFYYYPNNRPTIADGAGRTTLTINVQGRGGTCSMGETAVTTTGISEFLGAQLVRVTMRNNDDPIRVTDVSATGSIAEPLDITACRSGLVFDIAPSDCPATNGFDRSIARGGTQDLYVVLEPTIGAVAPIGGVGGSGGGSGSSGGSGGSSGPETTITLTAETVSAVCGGTATCTDTVDLYGTSSCTIDPTTLTLDTREIGEFSATCRDGRGREVDCVGGEWTSRGLSGGFLTESDGEATFYTTASRGSHGSVTYRIGSSECSSSITVGRDPSRTDYHCTFSPAGATLNTLGSQAFEFRCSDEAGRLSQTAASYTLIDSLRGTLSDSTTTGVRYTAPITITRGTLRGAGTFTIHPPHVIGAVALAPITVENSDCVDEPPPCERPSVLMCVRGSWVCMPADDICPTATRPECEAGASAVCLEAGWECVPDETDDGDDDGSSEHCTIGGTVLPTVYPGWHGWLPIACGTARGPCTPATSVTWVNGEGTSVSGTNSGAYVTVAMGAGSTIRIEAYINGDSSRNCYRELEVSETPECVFVS